MATTIMKNLARKHLLKITPYKPGKPIKELKRELGLKKAIKLASNENALKPSLKVLLKVTSELADLNRYPDGGCFYLKAKLARKFRLKPKNFVIGNGSDEVITFAIKAFVKENEEVLIAKPTFLIYGIASKVANVKTITIPLKNFKYDLEKMKKRVTRKTKLIFIANPDNPTGSYVSRKEVEKFLRGLRKDIIIFFDEAYYEFGKQFRDYPETLKLLNSRNIIITRSFSKIYSLAGLRVGYGIAKPSLIEAMEKVREPFNVNSLAQAGALAALEDNEHIKRTLEFTGRGKEFLYSQLSELGIKYVPSATNFVLIKIGRNAAKVYNNLLRKGIIVRYMAAWGLKDFIRVTIGTMDENKKFIEALKEA